MVANPQEEVIIPVPPRATAGLGEEDPRLSTLPVVHDDAMQFLVAGAEGVVVLLPHGRLEPLPARVADGDVREEVVVVIRDERAGHELPEGVVGLGAHDVVAERAAAAVGRPCWVVEQRRELLETALAW